MLQHGNRTMKSTPYDNDRSAEKLGGKGLEVDNKVFLPHAFVRTDRDLSRICLQVKQGWLIIFESSF